MYVYLVTSGSLRGAAAAVLCLIQYDNSFLDNLHQQVVVFVVVVVVLTLLTRIIKPAVTEQAPDTLELRNTPGKKHKQTKGGTRIYIYIYHNC